MTPELLAACESLLLLAAERVDDLYDEVDRLGADADRPEEDLPSARNRADRALRKLTEARVAIAKARGGVA